MDGTIIGTASRQRYEKDACEIVVVGKNFQKRILANLGFHVTANTKSKSTTPEILPPVPKASQHMLRTSAFGIEIV